MSPRAPAQRAARLGVLLLGCTVAGLSGACEKQPATRIADPIEDPVMEPPPEPVVAPRPEAEREDQGAPAGAPTAGGGDGVVAEVVEENVRAPEVRLRLEVVPRSANAQVIWGKKVLGKAPLDIKWPRRSGPLEVVIRAEGYLDYHTRLFTDRDDRLIVHLVTPQEKVNLLGYRRSADAGARGADAGRP